jgi:hypothetical protein
MIVRIAAGLALIAAASAQAATGSAATGHSAFEGKAAADPNRTICKSRGVIGSRLKRIRECATALEWEEMEFQERLGLARKQVNGDPGCNNGGPVCNPIMRGGKDTPW